MNTQDADMINNFCAAGAYQAMLDGFWHYTAVIFIVAGISFMGGALFRHHTGRLP